MKLFSNLSRTLMLTLLVAALGACDDPWDRVQGEPSENLPVTDQAPEEADAQGTAHGAEDDH